ncbi:MAG: PfkB family carbohydrate kinase [Eubacteriales bacterium]
MGVCLIAKVGNDVDATMAFQALNSEGVNTTGVRRELGSDTGKAYIHVQEDGESMMTLFPGANGTMTAEYVRSMSHLFQNAGYCLLSTGPAPDCVLQAARLSKGHGAQTIFKPSSGVEIPEELYRLPTSSCPTAMRRPNWPPSLGWSGRRNIFWNKECRMSSSP